jgi:glycosyltransferase involved in cell wall biosynthesis
MEEHLISVIIPIYRVKEFITDCLDGVVAQTYRNLEIILVNDGCPEGCGEICEDYARKDARISVIHKRNGGLSDARNAGLDIATGAYISFIDGDDMVMPVFIETMYRNLKQFDADISMISSFRNLTDLEPIAQCSRITCYPNYEDFLLDERITESKIEVWKKLYKREIWKGLRFPVGRKSEDTFVFPFVVFNRKIVYSEQQLYYYRFNPNSIMALFDEQLAEDINESYFSNIDFFKAVLPAQIKNIQRDQVEYNYAYYLRNKTFSKSCEKYLKQNIRSVYEAYPLKTVVRLYLVICLRQIQNVFSRPKFIQS